MYVIEWDCRYGVIHVFDVADGSAYMWDSVRCVEMAGYVLFWCCVYDGV